MTSASGAHEAFRRIYEANVRAVLAYARRRTSEDDANDVVADTFLVAWRRLDRVPAAEQARPWLYGVARRVLADQRRAAQRRTRLQQRLAGLPSEVSEWDPPDDAGEAGSIRKALTRLKPADEEVLKLSSWEELSNSEIATVLGCSTNAAAIRLHRARRRFAAALADVAAQQASRGEGGDDGRRRSS